MNERDVKELSAAELAEVVAGCARRVDCVAVDRKTSLIFPDGPGSGGDQEKKVYKILP